VLGSYGNTVVRTPNLDRLAQMGTRFKNHFACAPAPAPGRATLLTGRTTMQLKPSDAGLEKILGAAGYACGSGDVAGAAQWIDGQSAGKPFFLTVALRSLQPPYDGVAQKYHDFYSAATFDTFSRDPVAPNAKAGKEMLADVAGNLRKYAAAVTSLDDEAQTVLARLTQKRLLENTLVVFASTCGALLGRHGLWDAGPASDPVNMYDESLMTAMIWSWLGRVPAGNTFRPELVSAYDFVPTLCDLLGAELPAGNLCGRSYALVAQGKPVPKKERWRSTVFAWLENTGMARIERYKLVSRDGGKGPSELYDLVSDPAERTNQYANQQFVTVRNQLFGELSAWMGKYS
jgi:arylsulfatase A-like enzyme